MSTLNESIESNHQLLILSLILVIVFMATSCVFHDVIPICHTIFGCDHQLHLTLIN
jgi:hypothetical protein